MLEINPEKVRQVIAEARMFDAKEEMTDPGSGSNGADDNMIDVLEDGPDDATYQVLMEYIRSLDEDEQKWKDFISKHEMTWHQCRDGGFKGPVAQMFGVNAIPNTFTIDADGVLQDQHIGDASIEGKLKKLVKRAREIQEAPKPAPPPTQVAN